MLLLLLAACTGKERTDPSPVGLGSFPDGIRNVVVVAADTLRRDRLHVYGGKHPNMPRFEDRATNVLQVDRAFATSNWTLPTTASIFTGALPDAHGLSMAGDWPELPAIKALPMTAPSLVPRFQDAGYRTALFSGNLGLTWVDGMGEGFDQYAFPQSTATSSEALVDGALAWLDESDAAAPFFLHLQPMDTHFPYLPPPGAAGTFRDPATLPFDPTQKGEIAAIQGYADMDAVERAANLEALLDLYDEEVLALDEQIDRLIEGLKSRGQLDATLVVWTADHGELFDDGGTTFFYHSVSLRPGVNRVPLLFYNPRLEGGATDALFSLADLLPTVMVAVGLPDPHAPYGVVHGASPARADAYAWDAVGRNWDEAEPPQAALTDGNWKVQVSCESGAEQAFDLIEDPDEGQPFDPAEHEQTVALRDALLTKMVALDDCL